MSVPTAMITTTNSHGTNYCVNCADDSFALREKVEVALRQGKLIIDEPAGGKVCEGCGRLIRQVPAYERTYLLHPKLEITTTLQIPAHSAVEALWILAEAIDEEAITETLQEKMEDLLEGGEMTRPELTYTVDEPKMKPPPDFRSLAPSLGLVTPASPQRTSGKTAYPGLA
jgi:hypothetical protein